MYTQCPHCQTCFRIAEDHLRIAGGKVRCGSCQEVFDATRHLFRNLSDRTPITDFKSQSRSQPATPPPAKPGAGASPRSAVPPAKPTTAPKPTASAKQTAAPEPAAAPRPAAPAKPAVDTGLSGTEALRRERERAPDQSRYMESVIGNDRYNDLDKLGPIKIPGEISFGDSIVKFADEPKQKSAPSATAANKTAKPEQTRTPYEDKESRDGPATDDDLASLKNFLAEVDAQLQGDADDTRTQLDKDIDELLAFTQKLEDDKAGAKSDQSAGKDEDEFDLDAIAEFEKELDTTDTGRFQQARPAPTDSGKFTRSQELNRQELEVDFSQAEEIEITPPAEPEPAPASAGEDKPTDKGVEKAPQSDSAAQELPELPESDAIAEEDIPRALRRSLDMLEQTPRRSLGMTLLLSLTALLLLGGLGFQLVLFRNVQLAHSFPQLVPYLNMACERLPCRYSGKIDVSQIKLLKRDVRSHPTQPNALLISATFVNQAPFDQPYPVIELTLYDLGGNVVASRRFTPQEYLEKMYNRFLLMESGTPVQVTLAVLDPGKDAINFEFSFH